MSHLQHLALLRPSYDDNGESPWARAHGNLPSDVLQHLTQLTHLSLSGHLQPYSHTTAPALQHVSALQHLQELCLAGADTPSVDLSISLSPSTTPGISCLTALTRLELLSAVVLDVAVLRPLTQLQKLLLKFLKLSPASGMAALLNYISQQVLLQDLEFLGPESLRPTPAEAYAGLTASSTLQALEVILPSSDYGRHGLWQHVFPAGRTLLQCTSVSLSSASEMGSSDITSLVSCCPLLRSMELALQPGAGLMPLTRLTVLTELTLRGPDQGCIRPLAALTALRRLTLWDSTGSQLQDWLPLTRLQQLTLLSLELDTPVTQMMHRWSAGEDEPPAGSS